MNIFDYLEVVGDVKKPTISNNGYGLDIYSPVDVSMTVGSYAKFKSSFIIKLDEPYIGILSTKARMSEQLLLTSGQIIYPNETKELEIEVQNVGSSTIEFRKGDPILQIIFISGIKLT